MKSPSNTTVYVLALSKTPRQPEIQVNNNKMGDKETESVHKQLNSKSSSPDVQLRNKISNFVDQLHLEHKQECRTTTMSLEQASHQIHSKVSAPGYKEVQHRVDQAVVEAEKFHAAIEATTGMDNLQYKDCNLTQGADSTLAQILQLTLMD